MTVLGKLKKTSIEMLALIGTGALFIELPDLSVNWWSVVVAVGAFRITIMWFE